MPYLHLIMGAFSRIFISENAQNTFVTRIHRGPASERDIVLPPGSDSLPTLEQESVTNHKTLICFSALGESKRQSIVLDAFVRSNLDLQLHYVGEIPVSPAHPFSKLLDCKDPRVFVHADLDDTALAALIAGARASVCIEEDGGLGLAMLESLAAGVPVIVSSSYPAAQGVGNAGQCRLDRVDVEVVTSALTMIADDIMIQRLKCETATITRPRWFSFTEACLQHLTSLH